MVDPYRNMVRDVLGFWIPPKSSPTWILGMLIRKLGLKTVSRKEGSSGSQITYYSLATEELIFGPASIKVSKATACY